ncbi:MAG: hypothetical protein N2235_03545 [Fischerella sp.]|nr:hypothetical protein [Fischerella sp.]
MVIITNHPVEYVAIAAPFSAGFEAVDESFQTATSGNLGSEQSYRDRIAEAHLQYAPEELGRAAESMLMQATKKWEASINEGCDYRFSSI